MAAFGRAESGPANALIFGSYQKLVVTSVYRSWVSITVSRGDPNDDLREDGDEGRQLIPLRVVIVDRRKLVGEALASLIRSVDCSARFVTSHVEAIEACEFGRVDVVLMVAHASGDELFETVAALRIATPPPPIVFLTDDRRPGFVKRAVDADVAGLLSLTEASRRTLLDAIAAVLVGRRQYSPASLLDVLAMRNPLKESEVQILRMALAGMNSREIADSIYMSRGTVRNYLSKAFRKLGTRNRVVAGQVAAERGWV